MKKIKIISIILIFSCITYSFINDLKEKQEKEVQNKIIDNIFKINIEEPKKTKNETKTEDYNDYLGYIYIPKFNIKRLIKEGTTKEILDQEYVGIHHKSGKLNENDLIILAGHNIKNVFSCLHKINKGDYIYIAGNNFNRKFIVYDKIIVDEYNNNFFDDKKNELVLITCDKKGYRLLVLLKEEL